MPIHNTAAKKAARQYAAKHGVPYIVALRAVTAGFKTIEVDPKTGLGLDDLIEQTGGVPIQGADLGVFSDDPAEQAVVRSVLADTHGLFVYQEQVMALAAKVAGFDADEQAALRKALSKKVTTEIVRLHDAFLERGQQEMTLEDGTSKIAFQRSTLDNLWRAFDAVAPYLISRSHAEVNQAHAAAYARAHVVAKATADEATAALDPLKTEPTPSRVTRIIAGTESSIPEQIRTLWIETAAQFENVAVGDQIRFKPQSGRRWWTVRARNHRYLVATCPAPFEPQGTLWYTVVALTDWDRTYNGVGPGVVRSSLNTLGGGWDVGPDGEGCAAALAGLESGRWEISTRRVCRVEGVEINSKPQPGPKGVDPIAELRSRADRAEQGREGAEHPSVPDADCSCGGGYPCCDDRTTHVNRT